jgi:K+-sensing histidine kinase KdpD
VPRSRRAAAGRPENETSRFREQFIAALGHDLGNPLASISAGACKLVEFATSVEAVQDGRVYIERNNASFMFKLKGSGPEFGAGL